MCDRHTVTSASRGKSRPQRVDWERAQHDIASRKGHCGLKFYPSFILIVACVAAVSFLFQAEIERASEKAGEHGRSTTGLSKN